MTVSLNPSTLAVIAPVSGTNAVSGAVTLTGNSTYTGAATLSVVASGLPAGITPNASPNPVTLSNNTGTSNLSLTAGTTATPGTYTITLQATGGNASGSTPVTLMVKAEPTLSVSAASNTPSLIAPVSGTATVTDVITLTAGGTYSGTATPSISGLPTGVTASWSTNPVSLSGTTQTTTLLLTASTSVAAGTYPLTVAATGSDGASANTSITLTVNPKPTLSLTSGLTGTQLLNVLGYDEVSASGAVFSLNDLITVNTCGTFAENVTVTVSGMPSLITSNWTSNSTTITPSSNTGTSTLTLNSGTNDYNSIGTSTITITANGDGLTATTTLALSVQPANMTASPEIINPTLGISHYNGQMTTFNSAWFHCGGSTRSSTPVTLTVSNLPAGVTGGTSSSTCANSSWNVPALSISVNPNGAVAQPGTTPVIATISAGNGYVATITFNLVLKP